jgi:transposase
LAFYDFYTVQLQACDAEIQRTYSLIRLEWGDPTGDTEPPLPPAKRGSHSKNAPQDRQVRAHLERICGVDLVAVHGISVSLAQTMVAEIGTGMSEFSNEKHADAAHPSCSWIGLAPHNDISGGKVLKSRALKTRNHAGQAFRLAAAAIVRADCAAGAFYRHVKSRLGPAQAIVATAHMIARIVYRMLRDKVEYEAIRAAEYEQRYREREIKYLQRKAAKLGL